MPAYGRGTYGLGVYGIGEIEVFDQTITVNRATETDSARPVGFTKTIAVNRATETDSARPITVVQGPPRQVLTLGQAVEVDSAQVVTVVAEMVVNQALEVDEAHVLTPVQIDVDYAAGWSVGVDYQDPTVTWLRPSPVLPPGAPAEVTASVTTVLPDGSYHSALGFYTVDDGSGYGAEVGPNRDFLVEWWAYQETETDFSIVWVSDDGTMSGTLWSNASEPTYLGEWQHTRKILTTPTDADQVFFTFQGGRVHMAELSIRSGPLDPELAPAREDDSAQPITPALTTRVTLGQASEVDSALELTVFQGVIVEVGEAEETDEAQIIRVGQGQSVEVAEELDEAQPILPYQVPVIGQASETDTALAITVLRGARTVTVGRATETDTALEMTYVEFAEMFVELAEELDEAMAITPYRVPGRLTLGNGRRSRARFS